MPHLRVLVNGAGIAGNALAFWLSKLGHSVTVLEQHPTLRTNGLQIDLRGHGIEVLKRMGLEAAFRSKMAPEQGVEVVDKTGKRRAFFPVNKTGKGAQAFTTEYEIMRGDLCRLLYDATKDRACYLFGTSIESFEQRGNAVEVTFTNGETGRFDLLVGADGQWSRTRKMMFGPDASDGFRPLGGLYASYCTIPQPIQDGEEYIATCYIAPGNRGIMTRRHNPHEIQAYLGYRTDSERIKNAYRGGVEREKEAVAEVLEGAGWRTEEYVKLMTDSDNFYLECVGLVKLRSWTSGRVTLVGDAAYCPSVMTGMGTTCAMVGAYVLAGEIGKHFGRGDAGGEGSVELDHVTAGLTAYEGKFRPFMDQVQKGVLENGGFRLPSTPLTISIFHVLAGLVSFLKLNVVGEWLLKEKVDWELPDYERMVGN